ETTACVLAERAMNRHLQGGCQVPIAGYAIIEEGQLFLRALVGEVDGSSILRAEGRSAVADAETLGIQVAEKL
ncbi:porphobilinogen deaminase, partial [Pasteurella multocida subsp. multocida str. Anand1_cattle]